MLLRTQLHCVIKPVPLLSSRSGRSGITSMATAAQHERENVDTSCGAGLAPAEVEAWRGLLRAHAALVKTLDTELEQAHGLPLSSYEVLLFLRNSDEHRMRMCHLAESALLS